MTDYRNLIEQPSDDRMDIVVYGAFMPDNRLGKVISEKEYMATEGRLIAAANAMIEAARDTGISMEDAAMAFANFGAGRQNPRPFLEGVE